MGDFPRSPDLQAIGSTWSFTTTSFRSTTSTSRSAALQNGSDDSDAEVERLVRGVGGDNFWVTLQGTRPRPDEKGLLTIGKPGSWGLKVVGGNSNMFLECSPRNLGKMNPC